MTGPPDDLRGQVIAALEAAGFRNREDHLPTAGSGGTFSAIGSDRSGVSVTADWWDVPAGRLEGLRGRIAAALRVAGFAVHASPAVTGRIYVFPPDR